MGPFSTVLLRDRNLTELEIACLYSISEAVSRVDSSAIGREADRRLQVGKLDMLLSFADISLFQKYGPSSVSIWVCLYFIFDLFWRRRSPPQIFDFTRREFLDLRLQ